MLFCFFSLKISSNVELSALKLESIDIWRFSEEKKKEASLNYLLQKIITDWRSVSIASYIIIFKFSTCSNLSKLMILRI